MEIEKIYSYYYIYTPNNAQENIAKLATHGFETIKSGKCGKYNLIFSRELPQNFLGYHDIDMLGNAFDSHMSAGCTHEGIQSELGILPKSYLVDINSKYLDNAAHSEVLFRALQSANIPYYITKETKTLPGVITRIDLIGSYAGKDMNQDLHK